MMQRAAPPAFPEALNDDDDDVTWALQTAGVQWRRGAHGDAIEWLRRAVESAVDGGRATRARDIQQQTNALEAALRSGWKPGSVAPAAAPNESPRANAAGAPWSSRPPTNSQPPESPRPFPLRTPRPAAPNPFLSGPTDNPFLSPAAAPLRRPSGFPPPPKPLPRPGSAATFEPDTYNELAVDIDIEAESARGVPTERSRFDPTSSAGHAQEVVEELPLDDVEEFDDADVLPLTSKPLPSLGGARTPLVSAPELETGPMLEADDALAQEIDDDEEDDRPTLPPSSSSPAASKVPLRPASRLPSPTSAARGRVQTEPFPLPRLPEARPSGLPLPPTSVRRVERERARPPRAEAPRVEAPRDEAAASERPRLGRPKFAYTPAQTDSESPRALLTSSSSAPAAAHDAPGTPPPISASLPPIESMPAFVESLPPSDPPLPELAEEEPTDRSEAPETSQDEEHTERRLEAAEPVASEKSFSEPPSEETTERDLDTVPEGDGVPSSRERSRLLESEPGTSPDLRASFTVEENPSSVAPDTENENDREKPSAEGPAELGGILLSSVPGLEDLPDDSQLELVRRAELVTLAASEEVAGFGLALVLEGLVAVMPTIADVAAAHARRGELVFAKTHVEETLPMRVVAGPEGAKVATWPTTAFDSAISACPWVGDDLMVVGDRLQTLVGVAMGPIGDQLDDMLRAMVIERCHVRHLLPGEVIAEVGKPIPGMIIFGAGRLEIEGPGPDEAPGPGEFVFASQVLQAAPAPATARAGKGGALILFADRKVAHELLVSVPPLLGIFAQ